MNTTKQQPTELSVTEMKSILENLIFSLNLSKISFIPNKDNDFNHLSYSTELKIKICKTDDGSKNLHIINYGTYKYIIKFSNMDYGISKSEPIFICSFSPITDTFNYDDNNWLNDRLNYIGAFRDFIQSLLPPTKL